MDQGTFRAFRKTKLTVPKEEARARIECQIAGGRQMGYAGANAPGELEKLRLTVSQWSKVNSELLRKLFDDEGEALRYEETFTYPISPHQSISQLAQDIKREIADKVVRLESVLDRLSGFEEPGGESPSDSSADPSPEGYLTPGIPERKQEKKSFFSRLFGKR